MEQSEMAGASAVSRGDAQIRFLALRGPEPTMLLRFHPRLTVLHGFSDGVVEWLAAAFEHGRSAAPDGFVVVDGARVSFAALPAEVFLAGRCPVVHAGALEEDLRHLGQGSREELGFELGAVVDAITAARARSHAIAQRVAELDTEIARADQQIAQMQSPSDPPARSVVLDRTEDAAVLERLLQAVIDAEGLPKALHPVAEPVARALDALDEAARRQRPHAEVEEELRKWELVTAEARARLAERRATAPRVAPADLVEASRLREALTDATDRKRGQLRRRSTEDVAEIEAQFKALLTRLGAHSYDDLMLIGTGLGSADVDLAIREATNVVAAAERRCAELRAEQAEPTIDELRVERAELVERARQVLGYDPGPDPAAALRAYRVEPDAYVEAQVALARKLREYGARVDDTVIDTSRALIEEWREERVQQERGRAELQRREEDLDEAERIARQGRTTRARLTREIEARRTEIEDLEFDHARLESRVRDAGPTPDIANITPALVDRVVADMLGAHGVAGSELPIIVEDPFAALDTPLRRRALAALVRRAGTRQVVLVTDDAATVQWAQDAGDDIAIAWTAEEAVARMLRQTV
jgi:hypothetical protein